MHGLIHARINSPKYFTQTENCNSVNKSPINLDVKIGGGIRMALSQPQLLLFCYYCATVTFAAHYVEFLRAIQMLLYHIVS